MRRFALVAFALGACGGPLLANAPRPNPGAVAVGAAAAATAATLADPDYAQKHAEEEKKANDVHKPPGGQVHENVPPDVLDRLDAAEAQQKAGAAPSAPPPPPPPATTPPGPPSRQP